VILPPLVFPVQYINLQMIKNVTNRDILFSTVSDPGPIYLSECVEHFKSRG